MMLIITIFLIISMFIIVYAMIGYPFLLIVLDKIIRPENLKSDYSLVPSVTLMIIAHNEEKVILDKLENAITVNYPLNKYEILVASDNSTDSTNDIVENFIMFHPEYKIRLHCSKSHLGKTNEQNEAQKTVHSEILVMTDANTILQKNAIRELVSNFIDKDVVYVCGKLVYSNSTNSQTSCSESEYWNLDLKMRDIESRFKCITAGNGAIYACRNNEYIDFAPIKCHDSAMPFFYGLHGKKAVFNPNAVAVEKAGETNNDEFKRKIRMSRIIIPTLKDSIKILNIFKYRWFSLFYFGHRTCRYLLWLAHFIVLVSSIILACMDNLFGIVITIAQCIFILITVIQLKSSFKNKFIRMIGYYGMTILAQYIGVYKSFTGQSRAVWEKSESTR